MNRHEVPYGSIPTEVALGYCFDGILEIKDKSTGDVAMSFIGAERGHPKHDEHLGRIIDTYFSQGVSQQYPVNSDKLHSRLAQALGLPVEQRDLDDMLPVYEKFRSVGSFDFTDEERAAAIVVLRDAYQVVLVTIGADENGQTQRILYVNNTNIFGQLPSQLKVG